MKEYTIEGITFRQFCNRVRKVSGPRFYPTRDELWLWPNDPRFGRPTYQAKESQ